MQLGDLPLKYTCDGLRLRNKHGILGTLKTNINSAWYIQWDNRDCSNLQDILDSNEKRNIHVVMKDNKFIIHDDWIIVDTDHYTYD